MQQYKNKQQNIERPPDNTVEQIKKVLLTLDDHLNNISRNNNSIVIGDFNFDLIENNTQSTLNYLNTVYSNNFFVCDKTTVIRPVSNTCLDHVLINKNQLEIKLQYVPYNLSDHTK